MRWAVLAGLAATLVWPATFVSAETGAEKRAVIAQLRPGMGNVHLPDAGITVTPPPGFGVLDKAQSRLLFERVYGNPPEDTQSFLALVLPVPIVAGQPGSFEIVVEGEATVLKDRDPKTPFDPALVARLYREKIQWMNARRARDGVPTFENPETLEPARWDEQTRIATVGQGYRWSTETSLSVNYTAYVVGHKAVLRLTATGTGLETMPTLKHAMDQVLASLKRDPDSDAKFERFAMVTKAPISLEEMAAGL